MFYFIYPPPQKALNVLTSLASFDQKEQACEPVTLELFSMQTYEHLFFYVHVFSEKSKNGP